MFEPIYLSAVVGIGGLILYLVAKTPKPELVGRYLFAVGLAVFMLEFGGKALGFVR
jgi:hypothetical protein